MLQYSSITKIQKQIYRSKKPKAFKSGQSYPMDDKRNTSNNY